MNDPLFAMVGSTLEVATIDPAIAGMQTLVDFEQIAIWEKVSSAHSLGRQAARDKNATRTELHPIVLVTSATAADPGKRALINASRTKEPCAVRLSFKDAPTGGVPSRRYFAARVTLVEAQGQSHGQDLMTRFHLDVCSQIARAAASINSDLVPLDKLEHTTTAAPLAA